MIGRVLIVEDEPIVALDLQQELEQFGCEVVALAQSAEEAMMAAEEFRPDIALMDLHIVGSLDGIQTARLLREAYQIPSIFLTAYSDDGTIERAIREMPYGYLTKPFQTQELNATIQVALYKAKADAGLRGLNGRITTSVDGMREALLMVSMSGDIQFMNASAERLMGCSRAEAVGHPVHELLFLRNMANRPISILAGDLISGPVEEFGLSMNQPDHEATLVDLAISPVSDGVGTQTGYVLTLREATERLRSQVMTEAFHAADQFDLAPMPMVHMDSTGHIIRVNEALLKESGVTSESLVGRTLTGLSMDPNPMIAGHVLQKLIMGNTTVTTTKTQYSD
jgi:PAS domain S-box-containing protein